MKFINDSELKQMRERGLNDKTIQQIENIRVKDAAISSIVDNNYAKIDKLRRKLFWTFSRKKRRELKRQIAIKMSQNFNFPAQLSGGGSKMMSPEDFEGTF